MGLFKPGWMNKDEKKAIAAVGKIRSQEELAQIAREDKRPAVQMAAVARITDVALAQEIKAQLQQERLHREAKEREALVARLDTDEKRVAFLLDPQRQTEACAAFSSDRRQQIERDCDAVIRAIAGADALETARAGMDKLQYDPNRRTLLHRTGLTDAQIYLAGYRNVLYPAEVDAVIAAITVEELCSVPLTVAWLKEWDRYVNRERLERAVARQGERPLVEALCAMLGGSDSNEVTWAAKWLKFLYAQGKFCDRIERERGKLISPHRDEPPVCAWSHVDDAAIYFEP